MVYYEAHLATRPTMKTVGQKHGRLGNTTLLILCFILRLTTKIMNRIIRRKKRGWVKEKLVEK